MYVHLFVCFFNRCPSSDIRMSTSHDFQFGLRYLLCWGSFTLLVYECSLTIKMALNSLSNRLLAVCCQMTSTWNSLMTSVGKHHVPFPSPLGMSLSLCLRCCCNYLKIQLIYNSFENTSYVKLTTIIYFALKIRIKSSKPKFPSTNISSSLG